jgi:hypothetical protein
MDKNNRGPRSVGLPGYRSLAGRTAATVVVDETTITDRARTGPGDYPVLARWPPPSRRAF